MLHYHISLLTLEGHTGLRSYNYNWENQHKAVMECWHQRASGSKRHFCDHREKTLKSEELGKKSDWTSRRRFTSHLRSFLSSKSKWWTVPRIALTTLKSQWAMNFWILNDQKTEIELFGPSDPRSSLGPRSLGPLENSVLWWQIFIWETNKSLSHLLSAEGRC